MADNSRDAGPLAFRVLFHNSQQYRETVALRYRILREPLGLSFTDEQLAAEAPDIHVAAFQNGVIVGCLILTPFDDHEIQMRQVAVDTARQGRGVGSGLVAFSEMVAKRQGYRTMRLHARETAVPFYLKLGYTVVGEPFEEVTLPHREMVKPLV